MRVVVSCVFLFISVFRAEASCQKLGQVSLSASWIAYEAAYKLAAQTNPELLAKSQFISKKRAVYAAKATASPKPAWLAAKAARVSWGTVRFFPVFSKVGYDKTYSKALCVLKEDEVLYPFMEESFQQLFSDLLQEDYLGYSPPKR